MDKNELENIEFDSFEYLTDLRELNMRSNRIKVVLNEMFFDRTTLEILYLYQNKIENLETISFNTLYSLKKLHLFSNRITIIKFGNFIHLVKLEELKLDKNEIGSFDTNTFIGLEKVNYLDLSANKIRTLVNGAFHGLKNLQRLYLNLNDIDQIDANAFTDLLNLNYLNLDSNKIASFESIHFNHRLVELSLLFNILSNLSEIDSISLKSLNIVSNRLQELSLISLLPALEYLDASRNRLITIVSETFLNLKNLKFLNLSYNRLDLASKYAHEISYFKSQSLLETLDLSFNEIKYLDTNMTFKCLASLKALNLSNNKLKVINSFTFGFLTKLNELNLNSNGLHLLHENWFFNLGGLKMLRLGFNKLDKNAELAGVECLDLEQNRIVSIGEFDFTLMSSNLSFLNLNSNPIETIHERAFKQLKGLKTLKLSNISLANALNFGGLVS